MTGEAYSNDLTNTNKLDVLCPTTGVICPSKKRAAELYGERDNLNGILELPAEWNPVMDGMKLSGRLAEITIVARAIGCTGPDDESCPTRTSMNESKIRKSLVTTVRKLIKKGR